SIMDVIEAGQSDSNGRLAIERPLARPKQDRNRVEYVKPPRTGRATDGLGSVKLQQHRVLSQHIAVEMAGTNPVVREQVQIHVAVTKHVATLLPFPEHTTAVGDESPVDVSIDPAIAGKLGLGVT